MRRGGRGPRRPGCRWSRCSLAAAIFKETLPPGPKPPREFFSLARTAEVLRTPTVGPLVLIYFLAIFAFANFEGTLSLFTEKAFGLDRRGQLPGVRVHRVRADGRPGRRCTARWRAGGPRTR